MISTDSAALLAAGSPAANAEGWRQAGELGLALVLSAAIGLEREIRQKHAGLRTHTLVGVGAALFMLISKYGFSDVLEPRLVVLDPSRVAAQIVTGVGFLGAGLIFVRRDAVRGLTTAAGIWVTAAIGSAAGAGLPVLAVLAAGIYFLVVLAFPAAARWLPRSATAVSAVRMRYPDGHGILRQILREATTRGFTIGDVATETLTESWTAAPNGSPTPPRMVEVTLHVHGRHPVSDLAVRTGQCPRRRRSGRQQLQRVEPAGNPVPARARAAEEAAAGARRGIVSQGAPAAQGG
jgi:putative Mg2+ transporter-C (MgtC) family protein